MKKSQLIFRRSREERRLLLHQQSSCRSNRMAEVVGGTTAEMAAVCCCFPCSLVDFMVLTIYKVPKGLCRNALQSKRRRKLMMQRSSSIGTGSELSIDDELSMHPAVIAAVERFMTPEVDKDVLALENEMWEKFSESGFWRSPSKRENECHENRGKCQVPTSLIPQE